MRFHRAIVKRAKKIDPDDVANWAEDYLLSFKIYRNLVNGVPGLMSEKRIKTKVSQIDKLEKEMHKLEDKIIALEEKRRLLAAELEGDLNENLEILGEYLLPDEIEDLIP